VQVGNLGAGFTHNQFNQTRPPSVTTPHRPIAPPPHTGFRKEKIFIKSHQRGNFFGISLGSSKSGECFMAKTTNATTQTGKFPYPFRTGWALLLLAINFLVAAYYFHIIQ
jgi:hypothetical protein